MCIDFGEDNGRVMVRDTQKGGRTIVLQISDCWPVASWALRDFYRRPKSAYYSVERESRTIGVVMNRNEVKDTPAETNVVSNGGPSHNYSKFQNFNFILGNQL